MNIQSHNKVTPCDTFVALDKYTPTVLQVPESLTARMEELINNPTNHYVVPLKSGETLVHWNGTPHSRMEQHGITPSNIDERRKLIRCRTIPLREWNHRFEQVST